MNVIYTIVKVLLSSVVLAAVSEISKRSTFIGSLLASIPLVSLLAIVWLYIDTKDTAQIASLSTGIFWLVIPSLVFFIVLPILLKRSFNFWPSLAISSALTIIAYFIMLYILKKSGIQR
ncbi:MAG TPA: DUF3147 family protein [Dysgonamonadaceae bacterium]|nr:DUF3147 family protein [Dysgonamonadaceae bacterium]